MLGVDMGDRKGYGSARRTRGLSGRVARVRGTWFWYDGVRFAERGGVLYGWVVDRGGYPRSCGRWAVPGLPAAELLPWLESIAMGLLRKGDKRVSAGAPVLDEATDPLVQGYPALWAFLTQTRWEDDTARDPGSMLVFLQDGMLKAMLRDKNDGTCLWVAARGFTGLLDVLEACLLDPAADWRVDRKSAGEVARRVRK